jgi:uncharacterized protein
MSMIGDAVHYAKDSLFNLVTGLGTPKDPRRSTHFYYRELDRNVLEEMYRSDWLARRLVDLPAEDATREWRSWNGDAKLLEKIDALERKLELQKKVRMALIRARLYGGGALVMGVDQGQPEEELDFDKVGLGDLKFVVVCNRYELAAGPRIYNVDSPWYTRPEYYTIATPMFGFYGEPGGSFPNDKSAAGLMGNWPQAQAPQPILPDKGRQVQPNYGMVRMHPSRIIEFAGNELPDWRLAPMGGGWGDSILQTVEDSLKDFAMIMGGLASMINDMKMDVVKIPELSRKLGTADMTAKTLQRFGLANMAKSSINTLLLDKDEDWERINTSFGSTPELIKTSMTVACAAGGVPESRVMGNAPSHGLQGTGTTGGEQDVRNYYDDIASQQKSKYKPMLLPLDVCLQRSATGKFDPKLDYKWNPLYQPNPQEKAATALAKAQATQVYVNAGLINEDAMREAVVSQLVQDEIYPGLEDAIDEFGSEPEEPPAPQMPLPPNPPPGMMPKGQFDPNPFHMLRAQQAAKSGQPIRVPPNRPQGPPKYGPVPPGAQPSSKGPMGKTKAGDSYDEDEWVEDFNPNHDPKSGRFTSGQAAAQARATSAKRSASAKAAHAARKAREAEAFERPANATPHETGVTAVSRVIASHKGHATKGEIAKAAKADVMQAVETFAATQHLKTPKVPEGMDPDNLKTSYRVAVAMRKFFTDPDSRAIIAQTVSRRSMSFMQGAAAGLPGHALEIAHKALVDRVVDYTTEALTDVALAGIVSAATAVGGIGGAGASAMAAPILHAEIERGVESVAHRIGFTPDHIKDVLHGVGHALLSHYRKFKHFVSHDVIGTAPLFGDAEPEDEPETFDPVEATLQALADVLGEDEDTVEEDITVS